LRRGWERCDGDGEQGWRRVGEGLEKTGEGERDMRGGRREEGFAGFGEGV